jgi:hypothetical protein
MLVALKEDQQKSWAVAHIDVEPMLCSSFVGGEGDIHVED